jgi:hypothetical protein
LLGDNLIVSTFFDDCFAIGATTTLFCGAISSPKAALADIAPPVTSTTGKLAPALAFNPIKHNNKDTEKRCIFLSFLT